MKMDELLKMLMESELLTEDTKQELSEQIKSVMESKISEQVEQKENELRAEYARKFVTEKQELAEAIDTKIEEALAAELEELREDVERFRDLEAEYAHKIVAERQKIAEAVQEDMRQLMEALDAYVEQRLTAELNEHRESIDEVLKENYGRQIVESIGGEFRKRFLNEDDIEDRKLELEAELNEAREQLSEVRKKLDESIRTRKMEEVLESLSGTPRSVMEAILDNVPTEKLEEAYDRYIAKVLNESTNKVSEKESNKPVLAEGEEAENLLEGYEIKTGNTQQLAEDVSGIDDGDGDEVKAQLNEWLTKLRKSAGVK